MPRQVLWWVAGTVAGIASLVAALYHRRHQPQIADVFCPICEKIFSCKFDEIEAAFTYHEEYDCER